MINRNLPLFAIGKTDLFRTEVQGQEMFVLQMELTRLESTGRRNLFRLANRNTQEILLNQEELRELADLLTLASSELPPSDDLDEFFFGPPFGTNLPPRGE